jgi:4-amino-4-deoxy-L-arabinose transferase-like glycosyltransferase
MLKTEKITIGQIIILIILSGVAFCYGISSYPIVDMNEGLYAEIAREMLALKDYIIPHLNYVPYLEKPPLLYWLIALSYKIFGINTFAARLVPTLFSISLLGITLWFTKKIKQPQVGWLTAMILASSFGVIIIGRIVFFDMLLTTLLALSLFCFYLWHQSERIIYLRSAYIALALAFLTKGLLPVIIAFLIAIAFLLLSKTPREKIFRFFNPIGILLFFSLTIPWYIAAIHKLPNFSWNYFINEQIFRFFNKRVPHDYRTGSIFFYIPHILVYLFPWSLLLPTLFKKWHGKIANQDPLKIFLWLWFFISFFFLSISSAKGNHYMIIGIPPLAMLIAININNYLIKKDVRLLKVLFLIASTSITFAIIYVLSQNKIPEILMPKFEVMIIFLCAYFILSLLFMRFTNGLLVFTLTAGLIMPLIIFGVHLEHDLADNYNQIAISEYINTYDKNRSVYLFQDYEEMSTILFNLELRLPIINSKSRDLYFGEHTKEANGWFINEKTFRKESKIKPVYVVLLKSKLQSFNAAFKKNNFFVVAKSKKALLLSNQQDQPIAYRE